MIIIISLTRNIGVRKWNIFCYVYIPYSTLFYYISFRMYTSLQMRLTQGLVTLPLTLRVAVFSFNADDSFKITA